MTSYNRELADSVYVNIRICNNYQSAMCMHVCIHLSAMKEGDEFVVIISSEPWDVLAL